MLVSTEALVGQLENKGEGSAPPLGKRRIPWGYKLLIGIFLALMVDRAYTYIRGEKVEPAVPVTEATGKGRPATRAVKIVEAIQPPRVAWIGTNDVGLFINGEYYELQVGEVASGVLLTRIDSGLRAVVAINGTSYPLKISHNLNPAVGLSRSSAGAASAPPPYRTRDTTVR